MIARLAPQEQDTVVGIDWGAVGAGVNQALHYTISIGGQDVSVVDLILFLGIMLITYVVSRLVRRGLKRVLEGRGVEDPGTVAVVTRILHYAIMAVGILTGLAHVGINLSALFAAGAVFAVGIGFALQTLSENFVSGVILLVERSIKPGDIVDVNGTVVRVQRMGIRTTLARTRDDEEIIVPNAIMVRDPVKNLTLRDSIIRLRGGVGVAYESDMRKVRKVLEDMAEGLEWRLQSYPPVILLREFGSSSVKWEVSVWINDPWRAPRVQSELMQGIWFALKDNDITIAFPQIDVHFDPPVEEAFERFPRAS